MKISSKCQMALLAAMVVLSSWVSFAKAQAAAQPAAPKDPMPALSTTEEPKKFGVTLDAGVTSQYIWRGYDVYDDHGAFQPSVNMDLFGTGFFLNVWSSFPIGTGHLPGDPDSGINDLQENDYKLGYKYSAFQDEMYALDFMTNYIYYDYTKLNKYADAQELGVGVGMPKLIPIGPKYLVPSYYCGALYPAQGGNKAQVEAGRYHEWGLDYDLVVPSFLPPCDKEQVVSLGWDIAYSDGMLGVSDWSHMTFSVGVPMAVGPVTVKPYVAYQDTFQDDVNPDEDEVYGGVNVSYSF